MKKILLINVEIVKRLTRKKHHKVDWSQITLTLVNYVLFPSNTRLHNTVVSKS